MATSTPVVKIRNIRDLRLSMALTQADFGAFIGVTRHSIWSLENGKNPPSLKTIRLIHEKTGIPIATLQNPAFWTVE